MNYRNTFIGTSPDCPATEATKPAARGTRRSVPLVQYELLEANAYRYTQEDVLWLTHVSHKGLHESQASPEHRRQFFAKGQPCLRSSALAKRYGWGFHFDDDGHVALVASCSPQYAQHRSDKRLAQLDAMRNRRAGRD